MITATVTGVKEAIAFNKRIIHPRQYERMMQEIMEDTVSLIRSRAPVDTGRLLNEIGWHKKGDGEYEIFVNVPYAVFMEYGFRGFDIGTIESPKFMRSGYHPFIRSSIWEINNEFPNYIRRIIFKR